MSTYLPPVWQIKFHRQGSSKRVAEEQVKRASVDPRQQVHDDCYQALVSLAKEISEYQPHPGWAWGEHGKLLLCGTLRLWVGFILSSVRMAHC